MLKIYDLYGNQLGLIVGEYERELLVWLEEQSIENLGEGCINFEEVEMRAGKIMHILSKDHRIDKKVLKEKLYKWWIMKYPQTEFKYHLAVIYHNISKRDWTGINLFKQVDKGIFTLLSYKKLAPNLKIPVVRGDFPLPLDERKYLATIVNSHPHVVTYEKTKVWDESKKDSGVYTLLSLRCGEKIINRKLPYFIHGKRLDKLLLEITDQKTIPSTFVNGMKYSYITF